MSHYPPPCLAWAEKLALRPNDLSPTDRETLDAHVATCAACKAAQEDYRFLDDGLRSLPPPAMKPLPRLPFFVQFAEDAPDEQELTMERRGHEAQRGPTRRSAPARRARRYSMIGHFVAPVVAASLILAALLLYTMLRGGLHAPSQVGDLVTTYTEHANSVNALAWSPDGKRIASASVDGSVRVWEAENGKTIFNYTGHHSSVYAIAWSPNGKLIASGDSNGSLQIWSADTGKLIRSYAEPLNPPNLESNVYTLSWSPDNRFIASGSWDHMAYVWDTANPGNQPLTTFKEHNKVDEFVYTVAWSPDGKYIASGGGDGVIRIWDPHTGKQLFAYSASVLSSSSPVYALSWSPDGQSVVSIDSEDMIQIWNITSNTRNPVYSHQGNIIDPSDVKTIAWSPDGHRIAYNDAQNTISILDFHEDRVLYTYGKHSNLVKTVVWSPDGKYIASGDLDGRVQVWYAGN